MEAALEKMLAANLILKQESLETVVGVMRVIIPCVVRIQTRIAVVEQGTLLVIVCEVVE
jgi:hypothetical protein